MEPNGEIQKPEVQEKNKPLFAKNVEPIRTYQSDMAEALREQQGSVIKIAIAEQKRKEEVAKILSPVSKRNISFLAGTIFFLVIAGGIFVYFYYFKSSSPIVVEKKPTIHSLVFADSYQTIDTSGFLTKKQFTDAIREKLSVSQGEDKITDILLTTPGTPDTRLLNTEELLMKLESDANPDLIRSMSPLYMLGSHMKTVNAPFLLLKTSSYDTSLSGMLAWERKLFDNFYQLFGIPIEGNNALLFQKKFDDIIIENRDGRALHDAAGNIVLMYVFLDTQTILITTSSDTVKEMIMRMQTPN